MESISAGDAPVRIGKYAVDALLGAGGNGTVYRVRDPGSGAPIALKVLNHGGKAADLKLEFRRIADLTHRNLVLPYALEADGERVFFTMELVDGVDLLTWVRCGPGPRVERVRSAFRQLADGVLALHERGLVHRDLKPSNVIVDRHGRVAVLDFGLARSVEHVLDTGATYLAGTPGYLAPELLSGSPSSPASDAYALGVLLYECLEGALPYSSDAQESLFLRLTRPDPPQVEGPPDLAGVCRALLVRDPRSRPPLADVVRALSSADARPVIAPRPSWEIFGRAPELDALEAAFRRVRAEPAAATVHVVGPSGIGKSAILRAFGWLCRPRAWVLEGRAYERDAVPYMALDAAIDQLAGKIARLDPASRDRLRPADPPALGLVFPALADAFAVAPRPAAGGDAAALRQEGARAIAELLRAVAREHGLVLLLDDLQWGDADSARLLVDIFASPEPPPALVVLSYRSEPASTGAFLRTYLAWEATSVIGRDALSVAPLSETEATWLAATIPGTSPELARRIARESDGCPFLIEMLGRAAGAEGSFESALAALLGGLGADARRMLAAICAASRPIARARVPFQPVRAPDAWAAWAQLTSARLVRSSGLGAADAVEPYHDKIRAAVVERMPPDQAQRTHQALGDAYAACRDSEGAAIHLAAAGAKREAAEHAERAGRAASEALAFDRAAELYALAIECSGHPRDELLLSRARALADGGRGREAAVLFLAVASRKQVERDAVDLRREAMEQLLIGGHVDEGLPLVRRLFADLEISVPDSPSIRKLQMAGELIRVLARGPKLGRTRAIDPREELLLATCFSIGKGFSAYDPVLGGLFFLRTARLALQRGLADRAVRGIAYVGALLGFFGTPGAVARGRRWLDAGEAIARERGDDHGLAYCAVARGMVAACSGSWREAVETFDRVADVLDRRHAATGYEADLAKNTSLFAVMFTGDLLDLGRRASALAAQAISRGDLSLRVESSLYGALVALGDDDPGRADRIVGDAIALWTTGGYHFQHWIALRFRTLADLYRGATPATVERFLGDLARAKAAGLTDMQVVRMEAADLSGRALLACAAAEEGAERRKLLARVKACERALVKEARPHAIAPAHMLEAGRLALEGRTEEARAAVGAARAAYEEAGMRAHAATAVWLGARDEVTRKRSEQALASLGIANPARWAAMHWTSGAALR